MNREQKAATIETLAAEIKAADAVFAVDYRGISVPQAAELRTKLRDADATFRVVKNSLTERAADQAGAETLKALLEGPTALTFVHGDAAVAAKAIADYGRITQLLPFKGGLMDGDTLDADQVRAISRLPSRDVLYGQLVGVVASPISGLVRTLSALLGGLAVALDQVREKKEAGEIPAGDPPVGEPPADAPTGEPAAGEAGAQAPGEDPPPGEVAAQTPIETADEPAPAEEAAAEPAAEPAPAEASPAPAEASPAPVSDEAPTGDVATEAAEAKAGKSAPDDAKPTDQAEPESAPAQDDNQADASA